MRPGRPKKPHVVDEVATAEALVAFYEKRLEEAYERLGVTLEERAKKRGHRGGRVAS